MIINNNHGEVLKSSSDMQTSAAKINMTPEMLQLLSSDIYKYKIRAVIRELSTNAVDAHVMKGIADRPIKVTLPTIFTQDLVIRDFGFGLTHDQVMENYLTYGFSTKNSSNDYIGAMGIGCKSPFAYCDAYTVESIQQSNKSIYTIYKENGIPQITCLVSQMDTDEEDGLCIRVPIQKEDIDQTLKEAKYVFETFNVYPEIEGYDVQREQLIDEKIAVKTDQYILTNTQQNGNSIYAIMGQIRYPLMHHDYHFEEVLRQLLAGVATLWIHFDIGEVAMAASREELQMTPETKQKVQGIIDEVTKNLLQEMQSKIDQDETLSDALNTYAGMVSLRVDDPWSVRYSTSHKSYQKLLSYKGKTVEEWIEYLKRPIHRVKVNDKGRPVVEKVPKTVGRTNPSTGLNEFIIVEIEGNVYESEFTFSFIGRDSINLKRRKVVSSSQLSMENFSVLERHDWYKNVHVFLADTTTRVKPIRDAMIGKYQSKSVIIFDKENADQIDRFFEVTEFPKEYQKVYKYSDHKDLAAVARKERTKLKNVIIVEKGQMKSVDCDVETFEELDEIPVIFITGSGIVDQGGNTILEGKDLSFAGNFATEMSPLFTKPVYVIRYHSSDWKKITTPIISFGSEEFFDGYVDKPTVYKSWQHHMNHIDTSVVHSSHFGTYYSSQLMRSKTLELLMNELGLEKLYKIMQKFYAAGYGDRKHKMLRDCYADKFSREKVHTNIVEKFKAESRLEQLSTLVTGCYKLNRADLDDALEKCLAFAGFADKLNKILKK